MIIQGLIKYIKSNTKGFHIFMQKKKDFKHAVLLLNFLIITEFETKYIFTVYPHKYEAAHCSRP